MTTPESPQGAPWAGQPGAPQPYPGADQPADPSVQASQGWPAGGAGVQDPPGWQPGAAYPPPAPKGRSTKFWLIGAGVIVLVAAVAIALVAVFISGKSKPDITELTASMLLTENEFPSIDGGKYKSKAVKSVDEDASDSCPWAGKGHNARVKFGGGARQMNVVLYQLDRKLDLSALPGCMSQRAKTISVVGLPSGVVAASDVDNDGDVDLGAAGYVRGIFLAVSAKSDNSMDQAKSDLVATYNAQADKLNKA